MPVITLIRHGQAQFGGQNYDQLSELGFSQSQHLGKTLAEREDQPTHIVVGGMVRHLQSAEHCLQAAGLEQSWQTHPGFKEFNHTQVLERANPLYCDRATYSAWLAEQAEPAKVFAAFFRNALHRWISGQYDHEYDESWRDFQQRVNLALDDLLTHHGRHDHVWVFTSGGCISVIAQRLLSMSDDAALDVNWVMANCSYSRLLGNREQCRLMSLNEHGHFSGKHRALLTYR